MSLLAQLAIALAIFAAGAAGGIRWHAGQDAIAAEAAREARETDQRQQRRFNDIQAGRQAGTVATLNTKLGDLRAQLATLSGRTCLDAGTVGLLNSSGVLERAAAASEPARAASASAASDRDVAEYIATCRTRYGEVSEQLNRILDIEEKREPPD